MKHNFLSKFLTLILLYYAFSTTPLISKQSLSILPKLSMELGGKFYLSSFENSFHSDVKTSFLISNELIIKENKKFLVGIGVGFQLPSEYKDDYKKKRKFINIPIYSLLRGYLTTDSFINTHIVAHLGSGIPYYIYGGIGAGITINDKIILDAMYKYYLFIGFFTSCQYKTFSLSMGYLFDIKKDLGKKRKPYSTYMRERYLSTQIGLDFSLKDKNSFAGLDEMGVSLTGEITKNIRKNIEVGTGMIFELPREIYDDSGKCYGSCYFNPMYYVIKVFRICPQYENIQLHVLTHLGYALPFFDNPHGFFLYGGIGAGLKINKRFIIEGIYKFHTLESGPKKYTFFSLSAGYLFKL